MTEEKQDRRKSSIHISDESVARIASAVANTTTNKGHADCRFSDIELEDMREAVNFVKNFNRAMSDSRTVVRRFFLVMCLTGASGYLIYGWWGKLIENVKKAINIP